ncbi:MAG: LysE family translocator [Deltaproteobacteria bacterium]|nr:LysE family translocator [Deltaproteobacteria bacterium]
MTLPIAFAIGFSVASIPGPTILLIATEALRKGFKAGVLTMLAPLLLDALVMVPFGLFFQISLFSGKGTFFLGLAGSGLLFWLGLQSIRAGAKKKPLAFDREGPGGPRQQEIPSFTKGLLTHLSSPYPYIYWSTVGASFIRQGFETGGARGAALFPFGFWLGASAFTLLVIGLLVQGKKLLPRKLEPYLHYLSGTLLIGAGILLGVSVWKG